MPFGNAYFRVEQPFRYYRKFGTSPSNTWFGASQVISNCYHALNARPGDEFHALVGGLFVVGADGSATPARLSPPKHPFEKSGPVRSDAEILRSWSGKGLVVEHPKTEARSADYLAGRNRADARLPDRHPEVIEVEPSPELVAFREAVAAFASAMEEFGGAIRWRDHGESPVVHMSADLPEIGRVTVEQAFLPGFFVVTVPDAVAPAWPAGSEPWPGKASSRRLPKGTEIQHVLDQVVEHVEAASRPDEPAAGPRA